MAKVLKRWSEKNAHANLELGLRRINNKANHKKSKQVVGKSSRQDSSKSKKTKTKIFSSVSRPK